MRGQEYFFASRTFTRSIKCHCRQGVPQEDRLERLATASEGLQGPDGNMANERRPILEPLERAAQNICQLECSAGSVGDECIFIELEINDG